MTSVIIPTFNRADLLPRAVASAQAAGADVEVLVVDNASNDHTEEVCAQIPGIRYLRLDSNRGPAGARNAGIAATTTEWVTFLDDDDVLLPGSIDRRIDILREHPEAALCYGHVLIGNKECVSTGRTFWGGDGSVARPKLPDGDIFLQLLHDNPIMMHSAVLRMHVLRDSGVRFNENFRRGEDWDFWLRLCQYHRVVATDEPVAIVRFSESSSAQLTANRSAMFTGSANLQREWLRLPRARQLSPKQRRDLRRRFIQRNAWLLCSMGIDELKHGHIIRSLRFVGAAMRISPTTSLARVALPIALRLRRRGMFPRGSS